MTIIDKNLDFYIKSIKANRYSMNFDMQIVL